MAIPSRRADPGHVTAGARTFFVTSSICGKRNLLQSDRSAALFVRVLCYYRDLRKFRLHEFVVMPDHFHTLLTVESDITIEHAVQLIKGAGSRSARGGNSGSRLRSGKKVSRKRGSLTPTHSSEPANTSGTILLFGILSPRRTNFRTHPPIPDFSLTRHRRG